MILYLVYIIYSQKLYRHYVGTTDNVEQRHIEHNSILYQNSFTSRGIPWELKWKTDPLMSEVAYKLERFIKSMKSKKFIEKLIIQPQIIDDIISKL